MAAVGLCLAGQALLPSVAGRSLLSEARKVLLPGLSNASAWDDVPLCAARQPDQRRRESLLGLDRELACVPGELVERSGPLWTAPITSAEARQALGEADLLATQGSLADALLKLRVVEHAMPRIADRIALRRAQLLLRLDRPEEAYAAYRFATESPDRNIAAQARLGVVRGLLESGHRSGEAELDKACKRYPNLGARGSLRLALARAKETWNNKAGAAAIYRTIDLTDPESPAAEAARAALNRLRVEGVKVQPFSPTELIERAERIVKTGTFEHARAAVAELCDNKSLPAAIRGKAHALGAKIARIEGDWETAREEIAKAMSLGAPEALRYTPRGLPPATTDAELAAQRAEGDAKVRKLLGPRPWANTAKRGKAQNLKAALDVAVTYDLADVASEVVDALRVNKQANAELRFSAAILASGLASDESLERLLATVAGEWGFRAAGTYHRARALERLGRTREAVAEYEKVQRLDDSETRYYAMWAGVQLAALPREELTACSLASTDYDGTTRPGCEPAAEGGEHNPAEALGEGLVPAEPVGEFRLQRPNEADLVASEVRRDTITQKLAPLIVAYGTAYPWLARAADLVQLDLYEDAADEIGEAYLAYRDARGSLRYRVGVDAVLTGSVPPRHLATGQLRRDRLMLTYDARLELATVSDLLGDPGVSVRLRDERRETRPRAYESDVNAAAAKFGVDPNLLLAVMRVESIYHRQIVSYAGAVGLMQIMPRTGMLISRELGVEDFDTMDLLNPRTNLEFAAWYLSSLIKRFDGRLPLAIAAYNGGPHNVRVWMSGYHDTMPLDAFLERIPFDQTHRYVRRVLTHYAAYRAQQNLPMTHLSVKLPAVKPDTVAF